jgi:hypothetical protein
VLMDAGWTCLNSNPTQPQPRWHFHLALSPPSHVSRFLEEPSCSRTDSPHTACCTSALCSCALCLGSLCDLLCKVEERSPQLWYTCVSGPYLNTPGPPQRVHA